MWMFLFVLINLVLEEVIYKTMGGSSHRPHNWRRRLRYGRVAAMYSAHERESPSSILTVRSFSSASALSTVA